MGPFQNASSLLLTVVTVHRLLRPLCGSKWQFDEDKNTFKWRGAANLFNACAAPWLLSFIGAASLWKHVFAASASFGAFQRKICHVFFVWLFFFPLKKTPTNFGEIVTLKDRQPNEPTSSVIEWAFSVSSAKCEEAMINAFFFFSFETALKQAWDGGGGESKWVHVIEIVYYFLTETLVVRSVRMFRGIDCSTVLL